MLKRPIAYLERTDFTDDGRLVERLNREPAFVMFQTSRCGHCSAAKPEFQRLADRGVVRCFTAQLDGERASERAIGDIVRTVYPGFRGYPSYALYPGYGRPMTPYDGPRDADSMQRFVTASISR